jgi:predicted dehydrogenase
MVNAVMQLSDTKAGGSRKARIAVIGTGWWATTAHLPALAANSAADIVAICDQRSDLLARVADKFNVAKTYTDYRQMLKQEHLDGAVVSVWNAAHYEVARACFEHKLHVLVEKPLVLYAKHARELIELSRAQGRELIVGYPWHYCQRAREARDVVQSGDLGAVRYINCYFSSTVIDFFRGDDKPYGKLFPYAMVGPGDVYSDRDRSGGGQGYLQVTHAAALMHFITGLRPVQVMALMDNLDVNVDVIDAMTVRMDNGALANIGSTGNLQIDDPGKLLIQVNCDRGWLEIDFVTGTGKIRRADGTHRNYVPFDAVEVPDGLEQSELIYPLYAPANNLVQVIAANGANESPGEIGWRTTELLDAAYRSASSNGQVVRVKSLYE